jgi:hypothetical protein
MDLSKKSLPKRKNELTSLLSMDDLNHFDDDEPFIDNSMVEELSERIKVGEKVRPLTNSEKAEKKWAKIESKTEKLLIKAEKKNAKNIVEAYAEHSQNIAGAYVKRSLIKRRASYIEFLCMKGIKKQILLSVKEKAFQENGEWLSILDTDDIEKRTGSKANIIRDAIYRMKEEGWFEIIHSSYSGSRILKIYPEHFKP